MAFGILEDHKLESVPGTGLLSTKSNNLAVGNEGELKHGTGKYSHVVLIPQPSDDPRDPLNWPSWKKEACFWTLVFTTSVGNTLWTLATPAFVLLAKQFHASVDEVASSFGANLIGLGTFTLVQNSLAVKYGHRPVYLLSTFLMLIACIWTALSPNLTSICVSRVIQGFGEAAPKCLVVVTIKHLYFVHERGSRSCIWTLCQGASAIIGILINSYVIQNLSWQLGFWFMSIACGLSFVGVFFLVPETTYHRQVSSDKIVCNVDVESTSRTSAHNVDQWHGNDDRPSKEPTFFSQLKVYSGTFSEESLWKIFLQQFPFILSPVTWFMFLCYGMPIVLFSVVPLCASTIFTIEYNFNTAQVGLTNLGSLLGIVLAILVTGRPGDWAIVWMSQRNRGIYEPEYRLVFMLSMLVGVFGYVGWAVGSDHHIPWIGPVACITMINFSNVTSAGTTVAYLIDTHGAGASHIIALVDFARAMLSYGVTFFANGVVLGRGVKVSLLIVGACEAACCLASIPMYVYGKRVRSFIARNPRLFREASPESDPDVSRAAAGAQADGSKE